MAMDAYNFYLMSILWMHCVCPSIPMYPLVDFIISE